MARELNTDIDRVEDWDIDKFLDYAKGLARVLRAEARARGAN